MEKQPATKSYFFGKGYRDVLGVLKRTWIGAFQPFAFGAKRVGELLTTAFPIGVIVAACDLVVFPIATVAVAAFKLAFSAAFLAFLLVFGLLVYLGYSLLYLIDKLFCAVKSIASHCPTCQSKFGLPTYVCPKCGRKHTALRPSTYGILTRKCLCGEKLPTTFFNGRQKLKAICPKCGSAIKDGGNHVEITIPVVGGPSAGKTCYITSALTKLRYSSSRYGLVFSYSPTAGDDYTAAKTRMDAGKLPLKTNDLRLKYYQFYLTPKGEELKNLISLCDVAGEAYDSATELGGQIGYKYANAFLMLVDPLSVRGYRDAVRGKVDLSVNGASDRPMDEVADALIRTLESMNCLTAKNAIKTDVAVAFTKCDLPLLYSKIGEGAVKRYRKKNREASATQAQNAVCEAFLIENGESNFLNTLKSKFRSVQFFAVSALGHEVDGTRFTPIGVEDPVLWLVDKASKSIDLKTKWGKKI